MRHPAPCRKGAKPKIPCVHTHLLRGSWAQQDSASCCSFKHCCGKPRGHSGLTPLTATSLGSSASGTPAYARRPVTISNSSMPNAYTSLALLTCPDMNSSGDMCVGVPRASMVACVSVGPSGSARPKSATCVGCWWMAGWCVDVGGEHAGSPANRQTVSQTDWQAGGLNRLQAAV